MTSQDPILIVGAGISGLSAAYTLQEAGQEVIILEGQDHVGGRMTTNCRTVDHDLHSLFHFQNHY